MAKVIPNMLPSNCPNCNGEIIIKSSGFFNCQNHLNNNVCYGFAGDEGYILIGYDENSRVVVNYDRDNVEIWVDNEVIATCALVLSFWDFTKLTIKDIVGKIFTILLMG